MDSREDPTTDEIEHFLSAPSNKRNWPSIVAQIILGVVGAGAGILYLGPAKTCAELVDCGKWLSDRTSETTAIVIFTAGGLDFSAGAIFMGAQSADATVDYIKAQSTLAGKIGKGGFVLLVAATQNIPLLLASLNTAPALWQTILTVGGNLPGSLYGAINLIRTEIPRFGSSIRVMASNLHHRIADSCCYVDEMNKREWAVINHYRQQHALFIDNINARLSDVIARCRTLNYDEINENNPLSFLFQQEAVARDDSWLASGTHMFGSLIGFLLAINCSSGGFANTLSVLKNYIPTLPLQIITTTLLNIAHLYGSIKLTIDGVTSILDSLVDVLRGKPINSSIYQLRPKTTLLISALNLAFSTFSYAVFAVLFLNEFGNNFNNQTQDNFNNTTELNDVRKGLLYGAIIGGDIYHIASFFHLFRLFFHVLTRNQKEKFIFDLEHEVMRLNKMTESEFIEFVNSNNSQTNKLLDLQTYQDLDACTINSNQNDETILISPIVTSEEKLSPSYSRSWCSWFSSSSHSFKESEPKQTNEPEWTCSIM